MSKHKIFKKKYLFIVNFLMDNNTNNHGCITEVIF